MTLAEILESAGADLAGTERAVGPGQEVVWSRAGRPFAVLSSDGDIAEFALDTAVAAAAIRTPDTSASERGAGWVSFAPVDLDDHAADRATAWFSSAYRRLTPRN